jgi:hypothetical protein
MHRLVTIVLAVLTATAATSAHADAVAADVAAPVWFTGAYNATTNALDCSGIRTAGTCQLRLTTRTVGAGCASETVTPPGVSEVDTLCSASIVGTVTANDTPAGCVLTALSSLTASFTSGVTSLVKGTFLVSATFKPLSAYPVTSYAMTVNDASPLVSGPGYGALVASFRIATNGIPRSCGDADYPNRKGTPTPTRNGVPSLTIAIG